MTTGLFLFVALTQLSWQLTAMILPVLLALFLPLRWIDKKIAEFGTQNSSEWEKINSRLVASLRNLLLIRTYGTVDREHDQGILELDRYRKNYVSYFRFAGVKYGVPQVVGVILISILVYLDASKSFLEPAFLISFFYLFIRFVQNFSDMAKTYSSIVMSWPQIEEIFNWWSGAKNAFFDKKIENALSNVEIPNGICIEFKNAGFRYDGEASDVLEGLNFLLEPGKALAVTGPSGSGKSTLIGLALGLLSPSSGDVNVNFAGKSVPLQNVRREILNEVGYVGPESFIVEGTVRENLYYGLRSMPSEIEIERILQQCECQFLYKLSGGLNHRLNDLGEGLSAGQKQRICFARALLRRPKFLVLDEATSNLDDETEKAIVNTVELIKNSLTLLLVTHRKSLLRIADFEIGLS